MTKSKGKKWEKFTLLQQGQKLPPHGDNMQGFNWTPWNATIRTTAQARYLVTAHLEQEHK